MPPRFSIIFLLCSLTAFFLHREQQRGTFGRLDSGHLAWLKANRKDPAPRPESNVIFVRLDDIDHSEGERQFESWPPSAADWTTVLEELRGYSPQCVTVHPVLGWGNDPDPALIEVCRKTPGFIGGALGQQRPGLPPSTGTGGAPGVPKSLKLLPGPSNLKSPAFAEILYPKEMEALPELGLTQIDLSEDPLAKIVVDGSVCRVPLLFSQSDGGTAPSLILAALLKSLQLPADKVEIRPGDSIVLPPNMTIPIDSHGVYTFHLHPANLQTLDALNLDTFKLTRTQLDRFLPKTDPVRTLLPRLNGAVAFIGQDDRSSKRITLPDGRSVSAAELSAQILAALQTGRNVRPLDALWQIGLSAAVVMFGLWQCRLTRGGAVRAGFIAGLLLVVTTLTAYQASAVWIPLFAPLGVLTVSTLACLLFAKPAPTQTHGA